MLGYSAACVALVKASEGCILTGNRDPDGNWQIGWGHLLLPASHNYAGLVWTQDQADQALKGKLDTAWREMGALVKVPLTQGQVDALTDFTYNEGSGHLAASTVLKRLNAFDYDGACLALAWWDEGGGRVLPGLETRRAAEQAMWRTPPPIAPLSPATRVS